MTIDVFSHLSSALPVWGGSSTGRPSVTTAYLKLAGVDAFASTIGEEAIPGSRWLLDLNPECIAAGSTDSHAVRRLLGRTTPVDDTRKAVLP